MASLIDVLGKRSEQEGSSSYQRLLVREISKKLNELEDQNAQNAAAIDELKKLQRAAIEKMEDMTPGAYRTIGQQVPAASGIDREELEDFLAAFVDHLEEQLEQNNKTLEENLAGRLEQQDAKYAEQIRQMEDALEAFIEEQSKAPEQNNEELYERLDTIRLSIEDNVHKENIKCFRNVQGALEEQGDGKTYDVKGLKNYLRTIIWFQLIIIVLFVLKMLGIV